MTTKEALEVLGIPEDRAPRNHQFESALEMYAELVRAGLTEQQCHTIALLHFAHVFSCTSFIGDNF